MNIRDATPADADAVRNVHYSSITELGPQAYDQEQVTAWAAGCDSADYESAIDSNDGVFVVAARDDTVVGFGSLTLARPDGYEAAVDAEITGVYVHPSVVREGIGSRLYLELERRAKDHGIGTLGLWASLNAVAFYETHGYERVTEHVHEFSSHVSTGVTGKVIEMKKEL